MDEMTDTPMISQGKKRPDDDTTDADHMNYAHYMKNDHHPTNAYHPTDGSDVMM